MQADQLAGWTPVRLYWQQSSAIVDWCYSGERRFTDPFFEQTIDRCMGHPFNVLFRHQTPIDILGEYHEAQPGLLPAGFIFHLSRCGSTLITQMLAALPQNVVISEAASIDMVLRSRVGNHGVTDETRAAWLRWMISALGQRRSGDEKHFFIKFDCWSILDLRSISRALVPGLLEPELLGMDHASVLRMKPVEFCAWVLAVVCDAALRHHNGGNTMFINYRQLPDVAWSSLLDFFRVEHTAADIDRMRRASRLNAKNPSMHFVDDSASKNSEASREVREMVGKWITPLYERLEAIRLSI
jgi:hypothetical protein